MFGDLPEVEIQRKIANWKAEIHGFSSVEESASEDITIKSYGDFELLQNSKNGLKIHENHQNSLEIAFPRDTFAWSRHFEKIICSTWKTETLNIQI